LPLPKLPRLGSERRDELPHESPLPVQKRDGNVLSGQGPQGVERDVAIGPLHDHVVVIEVRGKGDSFFPAASDP